MNTDAADDVASAPKEHSDELAKDANIPDRGGSAVACRVRRSAGILDLDEVAPAVGSGAVEVGEAILVRESAGGE